MDVFGSEESNIDVDREQVAYSTWSTLESNSKKYVKIFDFKTELRRHGFLHSKVMDRPRKIYLIEGSYVDRDSKKLETFIIPLSKRDCLSAESLKAELDKVSECNDGKFAHFVNSLCYSYL